MLSDSFVVSYVHTLPHVLGAIYDELMQPLPDVLESILSPNKSVDSSVINQSLLSCGLQNNGPASNNSDIMLSQPVSNKVVAALKTRQKKGYDDVLCICYLRITEII